MCRAFSLTASPPPDTLPHQTEQERPPCWRYVRYTISRSLARTTPPVSILLRYSRIYPAERSLPRGARLLESGSGAQRAIHYRAIFFPSPPARVSRPEACGLRHLAFSVDDIEQAIAHLQAAGVACEPVRVDPYTQSRFTFSAIPMIYR
ncbi:hypothetical protein FG173_20110 [Serratia marcescens]|nr:hypothetical protein FG173_20110 [Serratia marcescens]